MHLKILFQVSSLACLNTSVLILCFYDLLNGIFEKKYVLVYIGRKLSKSNIVVEKLNTVLCIEAAWCKKVCSHTPTSPDLGKSTE